MITRRLLALVVLVLALGSGTGAASASGKVVVSADGRTWSPSLTAPLFDPSVRWAPGDVRTASFFVGNRSADAGVLALVARADDAVGLLARHDVVLQVRRGSGAWVALAADGVAHRLPGGDLAAGADVRVTIRATFVPASPNRSQARRLPLSFQVVLSRSSTTVDPPTTGHGPGGLLPETGGVDRAVLVIGLLLVLLGAVVIRSALHPREEERP